MKIWISRSGEIYGPYSRSSIDNFLSGSLLFLDGWVRLPNLTIHGSLLFKFQGLKKL